MNDIFVTNEAFEYLTLQRGGISNLRLDRSVWEKAFNVSLKQDFENILPFLPEKCNSILDIGGGMGGIDILLHRHFGNPLISILDGENDPPKVELHSQTFNSFIVSSIFLAINGVSNFFPISVNSVNSIKTPEPHSYDLILSLKSWCFHYEPEAYLDFVKKYSHKGTVIILDVRTDKSEWLRTLVNNFMFEDKILSEKKSGRLVFTA